MAKPVMLAVDDDPEVLQAVSRDLRKRYGDRYRVVRADSGPVALEAVRELKRKNEPLALFLVDQRMPRMTGVDFLAEAVPLYPDAKRALLTAYADTEAAIRAINQAHIDYYLLKPWDPPEQQLYPVLDDLLADWQAGYRPPFEGVRVVGHRWSPEAHAIRDFLARNQVPYRWVDLEAASEPAKALEEAGLPADAELPTVILEDGTVLPKPPIARIAEGVGLRTRAEKPFYELAIVGGGPAGLAAAVYGASEGLRTVLVEREAPGGQAGQSSRIENYLGFPAGLSGADLTRRAVAQARKFGAEILTPQEVAGVRIEGPYRQLVLADGSEIACHALLVATGVSYRKLDVPGCEPLSGRGVYYGAAATEAISYRGEDVYIVGGGNSAGQAAMFFSQYARTVTILVRGEGLRATMSQYLIDQLGETPNVSLRPFTEVVEAIGGDHLERLTLRDNRTQECEQVEAAGLFIFIGAAPRTEWLDGVVHRDRYGFIPTGPDVPRDEKGRIAGWPLERDPFLLETTVPGLFVAGDVRSASVKRVASSVGEGSIAVQFVHRYLAEL
ncbi:MAG TPA: FAD-dependent oxidoreductase [Longimicrobium sp.]|nr:FAD-dependent oxidoreductase [Longimicrobium sp.]